MKDFTIAIAVYGKSEYLETCLDSVEEFTPQSHEIFVVDTKQPRKSVAWAWNKALRQGDSEYCVLLNDDTQVTPHWLEDLVYELEIESGIGTVSPSLSSCANQQKKVYQKVSSNKKPIKCSKEDILHIASYIRKNYFRLGAPMRYVCGACMVFKRSLWEKFNSNQPPFDAFHEGFYPAYGEEQDFCEQVFELGLINKWVKYAYVHHIGKATSTKVSDINRVKCRNLFYQRKSERARIRGRSNNSHPGM